MSGDPKRSVPKRSEETSRTAIKQRSSGFGKAPVGNRYTAAGSRQRSRYLPPLQLRLNQEGATYDSVFRLSP